MSDAELAKEILISLGQEQEFINGFQEVYSETNYFKVDVAGNSIQMNKQQFELGVVQEKQKIIIKQQANAGYYDEWYS